MVPLNDPSRTEVMTSTPKKRTFTSTFEPQEEEKLTSDNQSNQKESLAQKEITSVIASCEISRFYIHKQIIVGNSSEKLFNTENVCIITRILHLSLKC